MSDAFSLLTKALSAPKDQQPRLLDGTKRALANEPKVIQPLVGHLLPVVNNSRGAEAELLRTLFIDVRPLPFALGLRLAREGGAGTQMPARRPRSRPRTMSCRG